MTRHPAAALAIAGAGIGSVLRLAFLGADSFWLDEVVSVRFALETLPGGWGTVDATHPPLYYQILRFVLHAIGTSEVKARLLSAVASLVNLALVYALGRRLRLSQEATFLAVALLAFSPIDIWYAREARMYALATTAGLLVALSLTVEEWWGSVALGASFALALYLDFTIIPLLALLAGFWIVRWWRTGRRWSSAARLGTALALGWIAITPLWPKLVQVAARLDGVTFFANVRRMTGIAHLSSSMLALGLFVEITAVVIVASVWMRWQSNERSVRVWAWVAAAGFVLTNAALAIPRAYSAKQILVTGWPVAVLVAAWSLARSDDRTIGRSNDRPILRSGVVVALSFAVSVASLGTHRADWRAAAAYLRQHAPPDAVIAVDPPWDEIPYEYYSRGRDATYLAPESDALVGAAMTDVWLIAERYGAAPPTSRTEAWLDSHVRLTDTVRFSRLEVRHYSAGR